MKIYEFRIIVPTTLAKYSIGNRFMCLEYVKNERKAGEGIEMVKNEPYQTENENGQYTYKIFHVKSQVPGFIRWAVPDKYLHFHEESWNAYPHYHTINFVPGMGKDLILDVESQHITYTKGMEIPDNALNLSPDDLKIRNIRYLDIVDGEPYPDDKRLLLEGFQCPESGITTPLHGKKGSYNPKQIPTWVNNYDGEMVCCIKVVKFQFKWWGLQKAVEKYITETMYPKLFTETHRKLIATSKDWFQLTTDDVLRMELEAQGSQGEFACDEEE